MCMICVDFQNQRMTAGEARRALGEMAPSLDDEHVEHLQELIAEAEAAETDDGDSDGDP